MDWATAGSFVAGRGAGRDRMTRLRSRSSSGEPLAELDQGLGQECACDERFGRLNSHVHATLGCSRVGWSSQPITTTQLDNLVRIDARDRRASHVTRWATRNFKAFSDRYLLVQKSHRVTNRLIEQGPDRNVIDFESGVTQPGD